MKLINGDCLEEMKNIPSKSIDLILTDPPYGYTNLEFDKNYFDDELFFKECYRVLKNNSFIVFTGYGDTFYKWNMICNKVGFRFKENPIWYKKAISNPLCKMPRSHEQISIRVKGCKDFNKVYVDYVQDCVQKQTFEMLDNTCKRINTLLNTNLDKAKRYITNGIELEDKETVTGFQVSVKKGLKQIDRGVQSLHNLMHGRLLNTVISVSRDSVYKAEHPTQKPIELMKILIELCSNENDTVLDCFMGSGSTGCACEITNRDFIGIELDKHLFENAKRRIEKMPIQYELAI